MHPHSAVKLLAGRSCPVDSTQTRESVAAVALAAQVSDGAGNGRVPEQGAEGGAGRADVRALTPLLYVVGCAHSTLSQPH